MGIREERILSVTVSAANRYATRDLDGLAALIWNEVRAAIDPAATAPAGGRAAFAHRA
ncbi:hypothetical protein RAA17_02265 [Komagataeibacter rhaeticus]|nr:hypothetical protein [Komagataeibacter rhaeticus]